ncbi:MAG TPA: HD domain-containing protein [Candidatus Limnocylindrales bacterium]|nr:HD domain-containing protein [Candidatus Limnocylindrales bacterium]
MDDLPLPASIAGLRVPQDEVSRASWRWALRALPRYLLAHSVRSYCWGVALGAREGLAVDSRILWCASLFHDVGLTSIARNTMCFEIEGAEFARRTLERFGMDAESADRAAIAIILHMQPNVSASDGAEALLLDRATAIDVRGVDVDLVANVRTAVTRDFPRGAFDRHFLRAIEREVERRGDCQSRRLLRETDLAGWMARSPWAAGMLPTC